MPHLTVTGARGSVTSQSIENRAVLSSWRNDSRDRSGSWNLGEECSRVPAQTPSMIVAQEVKVWTLVIAPLTWVRLVTSSALQSRKWQLIGKSQWCRSELCAPANGHLDSRCSQQTHHRPNQPLSLPVHLRDPDVSHGRFRRQLKGHLFGNDEQGALWLSICSAIEKRFFYLL